MTITVNNARNEYTATASQTVFSYTFRIFSATDLNVYVTPSGQDANDLSDITTSYTVSGVDDVAGGAITLSSGVNAGDLVTIASNIPSSRTIDYQFNGDFTPDTVNGDIDRVVALTKQVEDVSNRSLVAQQSQQGIKPLTLPIPSIHNLIRWRSDLAGFENVIVSDLDGVVDAELIAVFDSVALMSSSPDLYIGKKVRTAGYYLAGDGGGNDYEIVAAATGTNDGGAYIDLVTHQAKGSFAESTVNVKQFGAKGDGVTDDTAAIQATIDGGAGAVTFPNGVYLVSDEVTLPSNLYIDGEDSEIKTNLSPANSNARSHFGVFYAQAKTDIKIESLYINTSATTSLPSGAASVRGVTFEGCTNISVTSCKFKVVGGAVACIGCVDYIVSNNTTTATGALADAIYDNWGGWGVSPSHFHISDNTIIGANLCRWGVLVTGVEYLASLFKCTDFTISNNVIDNCSLDGIWINGREPVNEDFTITGNVISNNRKGIELSDCRRGNISNNTIYNTTGSGIYLYEETAAGGVTSVIECSISNNNMTDVNTVGGAPAIWVDDSCASLLIQGNNINGALYLNGIQLSASTTNTRVSGNHVEKGTSSQRVQDYGSNLVNGVRDVSLTLTAIANVTTSSINEVSHTIENDKVTVYFSLGIQPTATALVQLRLELPIASAIANSYELMGTMSGGDVGAAIASGAVFGDTANNEAKISFYALDTGFKNYYGSFSYLVR